MFAIIAAFVDFAGAFEIVNRDIVTYYGRSYLIMGAQRSS